jgi:hypothetical protein
VLAFEALAAARQSPEDCGVVQLPAHVMHDGIDIGAGEADALPLDPRGVSRAHARPPVFSSLVASRMTVRPATG